MNKHLFILLLLGSGAMAQTPALTVLDPQELKEKKKAYDNYKKNPAGYAFNENMQRAQKDDAQAMNAVGIMYNTGAGTAVDKEKAIAWFEKSAAKGYANALYNLGLMFKNGEGTTQDFARAFEYFDKAVSQHMPSGYYAKGYMLYKGLGCTQDYTASVEAFRRGAQLRSLGSMYMLGLCYRNGYGVALNNDSARYWLSRAAKGHYQPAKDELYTATPENPVSALPKDQLLYTSGQLAPLTTADGTYSGYTITYDWSGRHVISRNKLELTLSHNDSVLTGTWKENEHLTTNITAVIRGNKLVFTNTEYSRNDHYNQVVPKNFRFKQAQLAFIGNAGASYLAGQLQQYSTNTGEPEKPMYITLQRVGDNVTEHNGISLMAYPNPFKNWIRTNYSLQQAGKVTISLIDISGNRVVSRSLGQQQAGLHQYNLEASVPGGIYLLELNYGGKIKTTVVTKQ